MQNQFDIIINSFLSNNVGIDTNFLSKSLSLGLQKNIRQLDADGLMHFGGIGNEKVKNNNQQTRGDKIYWLDKKHNNVFEQEFLALIEQFINHLNSTCYTSINSYEFHYALYPKGSYYKKHIDQFRNENGRKFSLISYLNEEWLNTDGGNLAVYQEGVEQTIRPQSQTAVFFKSNEIEHEVMTANRDRMSVTGWLKSN